MRTRLSRRLFLASGLALPSLVRAQSFDTDVVIIGAGAAGLGAAQACVAAGKRYVMFEARDRIGGRVFTDQSLGTAFDAGAYYIHWAERNPWVAIARDLEIQTMDDGALPRGAWLRFEDGARIEALGRRNYFGEISRRFDDEPARVPDISFTEHVADNPELLPGVRGMARMSLGEEPERLSAKDYARLWSGDDLIVPQGYGTLVNRFGAAFRVHLSTPVQAIRWDGAGVEVTTSKGTVRGRAAIITVPVSVLAKGGIAFTPPLPMRTQEGLHGLGMGALSKVGLQFSGHRFGLSANTNLWDTSRDGAGVNFELWPGDSNLVVALFGGDLAREILSKGDAGAVAGLVDRLARLLGEDVRGAFVKGSVHGWVNDPWSLGCYSHALPGQADARAKLAEPLADRLWFAGEATAAVDGDFGPAMTAGGAFLAGASAARAIKL
jgi:monoamine oxidase